MSELVGIDLKRYRLLPNTFLDTRRNMLGNLPTALRRVEAESLGLIEDFGSRSFDDKLRRFMEFEPPWLRLLWPNLSYELEVYDGYTFGAFFPSLTGACCLTEAIINLLIVRLRKYFKHSPHYKDVYRKDSFQNWPPVIDILSEWNILDEETGKRLKRMYELRLQAVHPTSLKNVPQKAKEAIQIYTRTVSQLFGPTPDKVFWCPGEIYIKRKKENDPVVKEFFIPLCWYVGYKHRLDENMTPIDVEPYENKEVDDAEFRRLRENWEKQRGG